MLLSLGEQLRCRRPVKRVHLRLPTLDAFLPFARIGIDGPQVHGCDHANRGNPGIVNSFVTGKKSPETVANHHEIARVHTKFLQVGRIAEKPHSLGRILDG